MAWRALDQAALPMDAQVGWTVDGRDDLEQRDDLHPTPATDILDVDLRH